MGNKFKRQSMIAPYIDELLKEKRANGYAYDSAELVLNRFDTYCVEHGLKTLEITKDFLNDWMEQKETEGGFNRGKRISCVKQLLMYMATCGIRVYIPHDFCHFKKVLPHIFDSIEIAAFFHEIDSYQPRQNRLNEIRLAGEYRMIFRLYCCCGLRNSEAAGILAENVNLETGVLTILTSKGQKDRLVYLSDDLRTSCQKYYTWLCELLGFTLRWFFPGMTPEKHIPNTTLDNVFNRFWMRTRYAGCSNKPTIHDFRFTFVVSRMNRWAEEEVDLQIMMPYLSRYLGHKSINETLYYYYLVSDAYTTVARKDAVAYEVIPEVNPYEQ